MALGGEGSVCNVATCSTAHHAVRRWWWWCCLLSLLLSHISPAMVSGHTSPISEGSSDSTLGFSLSSNDEDRQIDPTLTSILSDRQNDPTSTSILQGVLVDSPEEIANHDTTYHDSHGTTYHDSHRVIPVTRAIDDTKPKHVQQQYTQETKMEDSSKEEDRETNTHLPLPLKQGTVTHSKEGRTVGPRVFTMERQINQKTATTKEDTEETANNRPINHAAIARQGKPGRDPQKRRRMHGRTNSDDEDSSDKSPENKKPKTTGGGKST